MIFFRQFFLTLLSILATSNAQAEQNTDVQYVSQLCVTNGQSATVPSALEGYCRSITQQGIKPTGLYSILEMCALVPESEDEFWDALEENGWKDAPEYDVTQFMTDQAAATPPEIAFVTFILKGQSFARKENVPPLENYIDVGVSAVKTVLGSSRGRVMINDDFDLLTVSLGHTPGQKEKGPTSVNCHYSGARLGSDFSALKLISELAGEEPFFGEFRDVLVGKASFSDTVSSTFLIGIYNHRPLSKYLGRKEKNRSVINIVTEKSDDN